MAEVPDNHRITFPYQCIGKLLYKKKSENFTGTAFAVNVKGARNIIFTSASCLFDENGQAQSMEFIPAMKSDGSQPYGSFKQIKGGKGVAWFVHPNWDPITKPHAYDLGAIKVGLNNKGKDLGDILPLLDVDFDVPVEENMKWNIVWYSQLKMFQSESRFIGTTEKGTSVFALHDSERIPPEANGAPWLLLAGHNKRVNGHCIRYSVTEKALSPFYSLGLIREVLNQM